jgi:hypothetical protein
VQIVLWSNVCMWQTSKLSPLLLLNILHHTYILSSNFYQYRSMCYKSMCVCMHTYICKKKGKETKTHLPFSSSFFFFVKWGIEKKSAHNVYHMKIESI